jgi:hypothetical protein
MVTYSGRGTSPPCLTSFSSTLSILGTDLLPQPVHTAVLATGDEGERPDRRLGDLSHITRQHLEDKSIIVNKYSHVLERGMF